ncbi:hypothetical protein KKG71_04085 [Patescibacteria group bacterium]|nr:hypothetical protein [Patescibacteria group bacterium]
MKKAIKLLILIIFASSLILFPASVFATGPGAGIAGAFEMIFYMIVRTALIIMFISTLIIYCIIYLLDRKAGWQWKRFFFILFISLIFAVTSGILVSALKDILGSLTIGAIVFFIFGVITGTIIGYFLYQIFFKVIANKKSTKTLISIWIITLIITFLRIFIFNAVTYDHPKFSFSYPEYLSISTRFEEAKHDMPLIGDEDNANEYPIKVENISMSKSEPTVILIKDNDHNLYTVYIYNIRSGNELSIILSSLEFKEKREVKPLPTPIPTPIPKTTAQLISEIDNWTTFAEYNGIASAKFKYPKEVKFESEDSQNATIDLEWCGVSYSLINSYSSDEGIDYPVNQVLGVSNKWNEKIGNNTFWVANGINPSFIGCQYLIKEPNHSFYHKFTTWGVSCDGEKGDIEKYKLIKKIITTLEFR